jgi:Lrp/AsnC family leucine-responsive transcriptional regulator
MPSDKQTGKLLYLLDCNSRASLKTLAAQLKIPETTAGYRLRTIFKDGIIQRAYPVFNPGLVGMSIHKIMLKLHKVDEKEIRAITTFIASIPIVNWVARFDGHYDVGCTVLVRHVGQVSEFLNQIRQKFSRQIRQLSYAVNLKAEFFPRDYLIRDARRGTHNATYTSFAAHNRTITLDEIDWGILRALALDARTTAAEIAPSLAVTPETISRRLRKLEQNRVITGYRLAINHEAINRISYYLLLSLNFASTEKVNQLISFLRSHANIVYIIEMLGEWDFDVSIECKDIPEYRSFLVTLLKNYADVIKDIQSHTTWQVIKFSVLP